jgi:hypothetical protein
MDPNGVEPGDIPLAPQPADAKVTTVHIGTYLEGIETLSIKDSYWTAKFFVWFRWQGDKALNPSANLHLVDGKIDKKELVDSHTTGDGTHYQCVKLTARLTKFFNTTRVPLDDHMLTIHIEDAVHDASRLRYVADTGTNISPRVQVPGYAIPGFQQVVKPRQYQTTYGDPRMQQRQGSTYSGYTFAVSIQRTGIGIYFKLFIGLFAGVLLTFGSFFIRPADTGPRFGLPSAAYFGVVANTYLVNSMLPSAGHFGLVDFVTGTGLLTIFLCVVASIVSAHFYLKRDEKDVSRELDRASFATIGIAFLLVNIALPLSVLP